MGARGHHTAPIRLCVVLVLDVTRGSFLLAWLQGRIVSPVRLIQEQLPYIWVYQSNELPHIRGRRRGGVHEAGKWAQSLEVILGYRVHVVALETRTVTDDEKGPRDPRVSA